MKRYLLKFMTLSTLLLLSFTACSKDDGGSSTGVTNENINTETSITFGSAALNGTLTNPSSLTISSDSNASSDTYLDALAEIVIDLNNDGIYGDDEDSRSVSTIDTDGTFDFQNIKILAEKTTNIQLTVTKDGFAPVTKIISLSDGQSVSVITEAASLPVYAQVVKIDKATIVPGSYLKIGIKNTSVGVGSYAKIMSLSQLHAEATSDNFGEDDLSTSVIPLDSVPDSVTEMKVEMKAFDPTDEEDSKYFPGEYKGTGKDSDTQPSRLVSVGFDLVALTDQNGDSIELDNSVLKTSKLRPQAVDFDNCLQTKVRYLGDSQVTLIENMGDDDNTTSDIFEIPMWYYEKSSAMWKYLGDAVYTDASSSTNGRAYATMCVKENWGKYLNLDYDFTITKPKTICVNSKDQFGDVVADLHISSKKDTTYERKNISIDGTVRLELTAGDDPSLYEFSYNSSLTSYTNIHIDNTLVTSNTTDDNCDYDLDVTVLNPYTAMLIATAQEINGSIGTDSVYVKNKKHDYHYGSVLKLDEYGRAMFKIKPDTQYVVQYRSGEVTANANDDLVAPETADNGRVVSVNVQDGDNPPNVNVWIPHNEVNYKANKVRFYVTAEDKNHDDITFSGLTLNGVALVEGIHYTTTSRYKENSSDTIYGYLNLDNVKMIAITPNALTPGSYTLEAKYTDGKNIGSDTALLTVTENRAPVINGIDLYSASNGYINLGDTIDAGNYTLYTRAYDPDGDILSHENTLDGEKVYQLIDLSIGFHTIVVTLSDGKLSTSKTFTFYAGDNPPVISYVAAKRYVIDIASVDNTIELFAYIIDIEDDTEVASVKAVDQNGTTHIFNYNSAEEMYELELTPSFVGKHIFNITATDSVGNKSVTKKIPVRVIRNNQEPIFMTELINQTIDVDTTKILTCEAYDPEGTFITYTWYVGGVKQVTTSSKLTYQFTKTGRTIVSCTAKDMDSKSSTSTALITVLNTKVQNTLVVNTGMSGLIVALHDMETLEPLEGKEKITDSSGSVSFSITGDRTTFSVSTATDTILSKEIIFEKMKDYIVSYASKRCSDDINYHEDCAKVNWCEAHNAKVIPTWMFFYLQTKYDDNTDGVLDITELYEYALYINDYNKDEKISFGELEGFMSELETKAFIKFYLMVPIQKYNIPFLRYTYKNNIDFYKFESECKDEKMFDFNLTIPATSSFVRELYITGSSNNYKGSIVRNNNAGSNEKYSYLFTRTFYGSGSVYSYFFEGTADELKPGVSLDESNVLDTKAIIVNGIDFNLTTLYNGMIFKNRITKGSTTFPLNTNYIAVIPNAKYSISTKKTDYLINQTYDYIVDYDIDYFTNKYYTYEELKTEYDEADYPQLNINISRENDMFKLKGSDLDKINFISIAANCYGLRFDIITTQVLSNINQYLDINTILPASIKNRLRYSNDYSCIVDSFKLEEYKNQTEIDLLNIYNNKGAFFEYDESDSLPKRTIKTFFNYHYK